MYGGPITDSVYSCAEKTENCTKANNLQTNLTHITAIKERNGYFVFKNLPVELEENRFVDIEFFSTNSSGEVWKLINTHNNSAAFEQEEVSWEKI